MNLRSRVRTMTLEKGTMMLGIELSDLITRTIKGVREVGDRIGLYPLE